MCENRYTPHCLIGCTFVFTAKTFAGLLNRYGNSRRRPPL